MKNFKINSVNNQTIECEINSIYRALVADTDESLVVVKEKPKRGEASKGVINIFVKDENRSRTESRTPLVKYVFYPSTLFPGRLGSVAIYGQEAVKVFGKLKTQGHLYGRRYLNLELEQGRRPYVDVKVLP